jgi:hypothetical protein
MTTDSFMQRWQMGELPMRIKKTPITEKRQTLLLPSKADSYLNWKFWQLFEVAVPVL